MTQEEKQSLLFKDICAKLSYGLKVNFINIDRICTVIGVVISYRHPRVELDYGPILLLKHIKPYLRPLSSMTEEERDELREFCGKEEGILYDIGISGAINAPAIIDYLNARHFDFRNLIEKGLAIEAPEGMYETEKV